MQLPRIESAVVLTQCLGMKPWRPSTWLTPYCPLHYSTSFIIVDDQKAAMMKFVIFLRRDIRFVIHPIGLSNALMT